MRQLPIAVVTGAFEATKAPSTALESYRGTVFGRARQHLFAICNVRRRILALLTNTSAVPPHTLLSSGLLFGRLFFAHSSSLC
jgi:hypothetical protein